MKQTISIVTAAAACVLMLWTATEAQINRPKGQPINPYTGLPLAAPPANPLTGGPPASAEPNPFTGAQAQPAVPRNPYTGQPLPGNQGYNPLTAKLQHGVPQAGQTAAGTPHWPHEEIPITGKAGPGLEVFDKALVEIMERHGIPGAALAITKDGKLIYAKGFGWADLANHTPVNVLTMFGLASLSKPITAMAIFLLIERGQLALDDRVFNILKHIKAPPGVKVDPRLKDITIRHLLQHTGGWDRGKSGDPVTWSPGISRALRVPLPISDRQFISFMMSVPLDFAPGAKWEYSNVGYIILGEVIETVSGKRYEDFIQQNVLGPAGIKRAFVSEGRTAYGKNEARSYLAGTGVMLPPMNLPMAKAAAGWTASAPDMARFLTAVDGSRGKKLLKDKTFELMVSLPKDPIKVRPNGSYPGLGWPFVFPSGKSHGYFHDGNWYGMRTFMKCNPAKGVNWVLLFNVTLQPDPIDQRLVADAVREFEAHADGHERFPDVDLFAEFP